MIHWCQRLLTCTRQIGASMRQLPGAGPRSMPWVRKCCNVCQEGSFTLWLCSFYLSWCVKNVVWSVCCKLDREGKGLVPPPQNTSSGIYLNLSSKLNYEFCFEIFKALKSLALTIHQPEIIFQKVLHLKKGRLMYYKSLWKFEPNLLYLRLSQGHCRCGISWCECV